MAAYAELEARFRTISNLGGAIGVLQWDSATMMPPGGAAARAEQVATLERLRHELTTAPALADLVAAARDEVGLDSWQRRNLTLIDRAVTRAAALPTAL
ncbi:MAG: carboxypeptidase M32, partial [Alphaproteobacteria bacterium]|nr:carboxypeptidase M32 [Alphaproteobacteria bacterium]